MAEKIYTIPVNEAFDKEDGCPFCTLYDMLTARELELLMGGAMMEPDVRIETNKKGFCDEHFKALIGMQKRLPTALILESHLSETVLKMLDGGFFKKPEKTAEKLSELADTCYICDGISQKLSKMFDTAAYLYETDGAFRKKLEKQPYFCLRHYGKFVEAASAELSKKQFAEFYESISAIEKNYAQTLSEDVSWYCKKFDYRYKDEDWKNSKDSIERSVKFLCGSEHKEHKVK